MPPDHHSRNVNHASCLLQALRRHIRIGDLQSAVDSLPVLARRGLRPDLPTLASILRLSLLSPPSPRLARHLLLHLRLTLPRPFPTSLVNLLLRVFFSCSLPHEARCLFDQMPRPDLLSYNAMLAGYASLDMPATARRLFSRMPHRDLASWNTMIAALARGARPREAIACYAKLRRCFNTANEYTFSGVLIACVRLAKVGVVRQFHGQIFRGGILANDIVTNSLVDAYGKCGFPDDARRLFDEMPFRDVHAWTSLVSGYARYGDLRSAREMFDRMPERNLVSWSALISGYIRNGLSEKAVEVFVEMMELGVTPDQFAVSGALCACANIACLRLGKQVHCHLIRNHFRPNAVTLSSLIDMYSKCGNLRHSSIIFELIPYRRRDIVLWNTMISAFGQHGLGMIAVKLFYTMIKVGVMPDGNTLVIILTACSHLGLVREGMSLFHSMARDYNIHPGEEHHACFVDLLGRSGLFEEAKKWVYNSRYRYSALVWRSILEACRIHRNVELVTETAERLIELDPQWSAAYVLLENTYADNGRWDRVEKVRHLMEEKHVRKEKAVSVVEVDNCVHTFGVCDQSHPSISDIYGLLDRLGCHVEDAVSLSVI